MIEAIDSLPKEAVQLPIRLVPELVLGAEHPAQHDAHGNRVAVDRAALHDHVAQVPREIVDGASGAQKGGLKIGTQLSVGIAPKCGGNIRHEPADGRAERALLQQKLHPRLDSGWFGEVYRDGFLRQVGRFGDGFRKPQHDDGHGVVTVEVGIENEIGFISDPGNQQPRGVDRPRLKEAACGRIAGALRDQVAHRRQKSIGESGRMHVMSILALRGSQRCDLILQTRIVAGVIPRLRYSRLPAPDNRYQRLTNDIDIADAAKLLARKLDGDILFGYQRVGEIGNRRKTEKIDQQQTVRDAQA